MTRTQVAREVADALHDTEASLEATLASARQTLERMVAAKAEVGLTGTVGDAALASMAASVAALEAAQAAMFDGHREAHRIMKLVDIRGVASTVIPGLSADEDTRAA